MSGELLGIILPALLAGLLVLATHVPLGVHVLRRGIVFIDLTIAQLAALGVILAGLAGVGPQSWLVQVAAAAAALAGAALLAWMERRWPEVQEAQIGAVFVLAASAAMLLLAGNPHGDEHLRDLLAGQILWVGYERLPVPALVSALVVAALARRAEPGRLTFYAAFALAVTVSVQLVGVYLVFASLILPALASRRLHGWRRLAAAYAVGVAGYAAGLVASAALDLPSGALIVWCLALAGVPVFLLAGPRRAG